MFMLERMDEESSAKYAKIANDREKNRRRDACLDEIDYLRKLAEDLNAILIINNSSVEALGM